MKFEDWPTKEQAAQRIGISIKTLERMADRGEIHQKFRDRPGASQVAVFNPDDVERVASQRAAADGKAFVMPPARSSEVMRMPAASADAGEAAPKQRIHPAVRTAVPLWLRYDEAVIYSGIGETRLHELLTAGTVRTERGPKGAVVLCRADLDRLSDR